MPGPGIRFEVEIEGTVFSGDAIEEATAAFRRASFMAAQFVKGLWIQSAQRMNIRRSGEYIRGIQEHGQMRVLSDSKVGVHHHEIVIEIVNTAKHAAIVEDGHPAFSLVQKIRWGATTGRIKHGKNGPYLNIPFRHAAYASAEKAASGGYTTNTLKSMMPDDVSRMAKALRSTTRLNQGPIRNTRGQFMAADRYNWGGRLNRVQRGILLPGAGAPIGRQGHIESRSHWQGSKYQGLFKTGSAGHTSYLTIRTITPRSTGWNIPAQVGHGVARKVAYTSEHGATSARIRDMIQTAVYDSVGGSG